MILYFDRSALVKYFHNERGSDKVIQLIDSKNNQVYISELASLEFYCALYRRYRNHEINQNVLKKVIHAFNKSIHYFSIEPLGQIVVEEARNLIQNYANKFHLRTLDALQMATFTLISQNDWIFVAADNHLCNIVETIGFKVINPVEE